MDPNTKAVISDSIQLPSAQPREVLVGVKEAVYAFDPHAQIILFGSRARGDARQDSDYDFLILLHQSIDFQLKRKVLDKIYEVELQTGCVIGALIENMADWQMMKHSPIFSEIELEGIAL